MPDVVTPYEDVPLLHGSIIQTKYVVDKLLRSATAIIAIDDTVPTSSEGLALPWMDCQITPHFADSRIYLSLEFAAGGNSAAAWVVGAIFRGNNPDAILARAVYSSGGNIQTMFHLFGHDLPGPGSHTYRVRVGTGTGNPGFIWNGYLSGHYFGTAQAGMVFTVQEVRNMPQGL